MHVQNDANAAALAEWRLGAGRGTRDFCYVTVSTGRIRIPAVNGNAVRLEQVSSGTAIAERARVMISRGALTALASTAHADITAGALATAAAAGDRDALSIFATAASTLGVQLANLTRLIDPEIIALGGGVTLAGDVFWGPLRTAVEESLAQDSIPMPKLVQPRLGGDAGLHGAALMLLATTRRQ